MNGDIDRRTTPLDAGSTPEDQHVHVEGAAVDHPCYELMLFVNGASPRSAHAISAVRAMCDDYLAGRFHLAVVDVGTNTELVKRYRVLAAPTLVRQSPAPVRMLVGNVSDAAKVLSALELRAVTARALGTR